MATPERRHELREIRQEKPIMYGPFRRDARHMILLPALVLLGVFVFWGSGRAGHPLLGYLFIIALGVFYWTFVHDPSEDSRLAKTTRGAANKADGLSGRNLHLVELPEKTPTKASRANVVKKFGKTNIVAYELQGGHMGIFNDVRYGTYSVTLNCQFYSMLVDDVDTAERRMAGWASLLDRVAASDSRIERVTFRDQTFFREPRNASRLLQEIREGAGLTRPNAPNQAVLLRRLEDLGEESMFHRTTITLTINKRKQKSVAKSLAGGLEELVASEVFSFLSIARGDESGISPIGLKSAQVLTRNNLVLEKMLALDPVYGQPIWQKWRQAGDESQMLDESIADPDFADFRPADHCQVGSTLHKGYYLREPDQKGVLPEHFINLLKVPVTKTVTCVFHGVPPKKAQAGAKLRRKSAGGRNLELVRLGHQLDSDMLVGENRARAHEDELARSEGQVGRVRCYVDLTATTQDELNTSRLRLEHSMWDARFNLRPLEGRHHLAPSVAMPAGRGLALPESRFASWIDM